MILTSTPRTVWGPPQPEWALTPHPEARVRVDTSPVAGVPAGHGVLDLRVGGVFTGGFGVGAPRPQPPVVLIGSRPVTQGWGQAWIVLPAGEHVLEVQAGRSRLTQVVSVPSGGTVALDYLHCAPWRYDTEEKETALGPRGEVTLAPATQQKYTWAGLGAFALCAFGAGGMLVVAENFTGVTQKIVGGSGMALVIVLPVVIFILGFVRGRKVRNALRPAPAAVPSVAPGLVLLAARERDVPAPPAGMGAVLVDARFVVSPNSRDRLGELLAEGAEGRRRRELTENLLRVGEPLPLPHRPWVGPVGFAVDGRALALPWGRWLVPLAPGAHELTFAVARPSDAITDARTVVDVDGAFVRESVTVGAGAVVEVAYTVSVTMQSDRERPALGRFSAMAVDRAV
ncbi:hypothetical protein [Phytomonospora endophytica]|uniref:Uncharacterized protein n=1 Tax=Phytomonospora endophytica TaxID=714109 RepID=A0A841FG88_9ACTN|nr:hypothetical protein [Phytomonospora endophytica]MBB6032858.1 hypothetical protein [Phytomonospora endophytica]GIG65084.1 hypothetical protein Pen01_13790 [Phytomonospora endophytica]